MALKDRIRQQIAEIARPRIEPGEEILALGFATVSPRLWLYFLLGPIVNTFLVRPHYVVLTNRRLLLLRPSLTGRHADQVFAHPASAVSVVRFKTGVLRTSLWIRGPDGRETRLEFGRTWAPEAASIRIGLATR